MHRTMTLLLRLVSMLLVCSVSYAQDFQQHETIHQAVHDYVQQQLGNKVHGKLRIKPQHLDPHLKLKQCPEKLHVFSSTKTSLLKHATLGVSCKVRPRWTIYVPTKIGIMVEALISSGPLAKNQMIRARDVKLSEVDVSHLNSEYFSSPESLIGKVMVRHVKPGSIIRKRDISQPTIIRKGNKVLIYARSANLAVSMKGVALEDAKPGQLVNIRNLKSGKVVHAIAKSSHSVEIPL